MRSRKAIPSSEWKPVKVRIRFTSNCSRKGIKNKKVDEIKELKSRGLINYALGELYDGDYSISKLRIATIDKLGREHPWSERSCKAHQDHMNEPDDRVF